MKQYRLGEALRQRYKTFLGPYSLETVDARSTDYARTKVSLQLVLASLFPPENEFVWNENLKWQPVAFNYWPIKNDHVTNVVLILEFGFVGVGFRATV